MRFKRVIFFSAILCLSSAYSFGSSSDDKSSEPEKNGDEPMFIYKSPVIGNSRLLGTKKAYSLKEVESFMSLYPFMQVTYIIIIGITGSLFCLKDRKPFSTLPTIGEWMILACQAGYCLREKKFHHEAGKWLQELKEKELASNK
jgi:hypothetical protein